MKMGREILTFRNTESEKNKFYHHKTPNFGGDVDIEEVLIPNNISLVKKAISTLLCFTLSTLLV